MGHQPPTQAGRFRIPFAIKLRQTKKDTQDVIELSQPTNYVPAMAHLIGESYPSSLGNPLLPRIDAIVLLGAQG